MSIATHTASLSIPLASADRRQVFMRSVSRLVLATFITSAAAPPFAYAAPMTSASNTPTSTEPSPAKPVASGTAGASVSSDVTVGGSDNPYASRFRVPMAKVRKPHLTTAEFQAAASTPTKASVGQRAAPQSFATGFATPPAPVAADLAETDEVVLTPAIRALALNLGKNPVQIVNWVRNNVRFASTFGAAQSAEMAMQSKQANAFDTASLLIALLRASGVSARYAYGTIEIPAAQAQNWLGGVTTTDAALALLAQGGIPSQAVTAAGRISAIQLEHVWVEAYVDFSPSRAAVNRTASAWVPMDASYKQYIYTAGMDVKSVVPLDGNALATLLKQGATVAADGITQMNEAVLPTSLTSYQTQVGTYIQSQKANASVGDVLGSQGLVSESFPILAGTLPYKTVAFATRYAAVPDNLRWAVRYGLYASDVDRAQGNALVSLQRSFALAVGQKIALSFAPATTADKQSLNAAFTGGTIPAALPGYQFHLKAKLSLAGQPVGEGGSVLMGTTLTGGVALFDPRNGIWTDEPSHAVIAGETHVLSAAAAGVSAEQLAASRDRLISTRSALTAHQYTTLGQDDLAGELLYFLGLSYLANSEGNARLLRRADSVVGFPLPSVARSATAAQVTLVSGAPQSVSFPGVALAVEVMANTAVAANGNATSAVNMQRAFGQESSAYAHLMLERLYTDALHTGNGTSAVRALARANEAGQKLFTVNAANAAAILPQLTIEAATKSVIQNAAQAGQNIAANQGNVAIAGWNGAGYVIESPATGSGSYEITGRYTGAIYPTNGWSALALAGSALTAGQGDAVSNALTGILGQSIDYYPAVVSVLGDYSAVPWSSFVGAAIVTGGWWNNAITNGLNGPLGSGVAGIASSIGASLTTTLTGVPQPVHPPVFTSTPVRIAGMGQAYQYFATANDADGYPMTFSLITGPSGMNMSASGLLSWTNPAQGVYPIVIRVADGRASADQSFSLTVGTAMPLQLALAVSPQFVSAGDRVTITVANSGGQGAITKSLTVDGITVSLDANGQAQVTAGAAGGHPIVATANDGTSTFSKTSYYAVRDAALTAAPVAAIATPAADAKVTAPADIVGTASSARLVEYQLLIGAVGSGNLLQFGGGNASVTGGTLGRLDPSMLANGLYDVVLRVVDTNGQVTIAQVSYEVTGNLKVGNFTVSFQDLNVDASGIPIRVSRTYDSRRRGDALDFGYGWTVDYQNVKLQKNVSTGLGWEIYPNQLQLCLRPLGPRKVNITLPTGKVERFTTVLDQSCALGQVPPIAISFVPQGDTTSTLVVVSVPNLLAQGGNLLDGDTLLPWNPKQFKLTTIDGLVFTLDQDFGIQQVKEPNGNTLTYSANGITHSNGQSVTFNRDADGRITAITDPSGARIVYGYNATGDLISVTDRSNQQSLLTYNNAHGLLTFTDPRGVQLARNVYDDSGRLIAQYDAQGNKLDLSALDLNNNKQTVKDRRGNSTSYVFDNDGNVTAITDANGGVTNYTYDALGNELTKADPLGHAVTKTFNADSNPLTENDPLGNTTTYAWVPRSQQLTSLTDAKGNVTALGYGPTGNLTRIQDGAGNATGLGYDSSGNLKTLSDAVGNQTQYQYDAKGNRTQETDASGAVTSYSYDAAGHQLTQTRTRTINGTPVTLTTSRVVDADDNVTAETDPAGNITLTRYNQIKKIAGQTDAMGRITSYGYDSRGYQNAVTYPDGSTESSTFDAEGNKASDTDTAGRTTTYTYDALNRLTATTTPEGKSIGSTYDAAGRVTKVTDERGNASVNEYDAAGRRTKVTDALNNVTQYQYDANGNVTQITDALNNITTYEYDKANRRTKTTLAAVNGTTATITVGYDAAGRKVSETDQAGNITQYGYDQMGRLKQVTDAKSGITGYTYDEAGNKLTQTDALGHITKWEVDKLNRVSKRTLPEGQSESFTYDAIGNIATHTDFNGATVTYAYDSLNRLAKRSEPTPGANGTLISEVNYTYTASGQVASVTDKNGRINYTYDSRDRVTQVQNPNSSQLTYTYDDSGNRTSVTSQYGSEVGTSAGRTTAYVYDALNRLSKVTDPAGNIITYTYDANSNVKSVSLPNGIRSDYTYDSRNRLTKLEHRRASDNSLLGTVAYTLTANNLRSQTAETFSIGGMAYGAGPVTNYTYDALTRLVQENRVGGSRTINYTLDAVGNRTGADGALAGTSTFDKNDRILTATLPGKTFTYGYDANGNTIHVDATAGNSSTATDITWDVNNRLIGQSVTPQGGYATVSSFTYDADGNRIAATRGTSPTTSNVTTYVIDKNRTYAQVLEERDGVGNLLVSYVYSDLGPVSQTRNVGTTTTPNWVTSYYLPDGLGSVRQMANAAGTLTNDYTYTAYGEVLGQNVQGTVSANTVMFAGEQFDATLGLYYNRARYLNPAIGRFVSMDSFDGYPARPLSLNKYLYASADAVDRTDPSGKLDLAETSIAQGIAVSLAFSVPYNVITAARNVQDGADLGTEIQQATINVAADALIGAALPGIGRYAASLIPIRFGSTISRAVGSAWNLTPFKRGLQIEGKILGRPASLAKVPNFPVIDDFTGVLRRRSKALILRRQPIKIHQRCFQELVATPIHLPNFKVPAWVACELLETKLRNVCC